MVPRVKEKTKFVFCYDRWRDVEVMVKKTPETGDCLHFILLIVGVASVAMCWRQKNPNFAFAGSCTISERVLFIKLLLFSCCMQVCQCDLCRKFIHSSDAEDETAVQY